MPLNKTSITIPENAMLINFLFIVNGKSGRFRYQITKKDIPLGNLSELLFAYFSGMMISTDDSSKLICFEKLFGK